MVCSPGPVYPNVKCAIQEFLISQSFYILGQGEDTLSVYTQDFPPDGENTAVMVRQVGGNAWINLPFNDISVEIFVRDPEPEDSEMLMSRIYSLLQRFQGNLNDEIFAYNITLNTGIQRLDDLDRAELAQNSMIFDMTVRLI